MARGPARVGITVGLLVLALGAWSAANGPCTSVLCVGTGSTLSLPEAPIPGSVMNVADGTLAAPSTGAGSSVHISRTVNITGDPPAGCQNTIDPECGSALMVHSRALDSNKMMNVAITGYAYGDNTALNGGTSTPNGDDVGVYGFARKGGLGAASAGTATGGYFEGSRWSVGTGSGIYAIGAEIRASNFTGTDCLANAGQPKCVSLWITASANAPGGVPAYISAGVAVKSMNTVGNMHIGYQCADVSINAFGACYADYSNTGAASIRIAGTKAQGIDMIQANLGAAMRLRDGQNLVWQNEAQTLGIALSANATTQTFTLASGNLQIEGLKTTGAAGGKKVVCVDTATGKLYASSNGTSCAN